MKWRKSALKEIRIYVPDYTFLCTECDDLSYDNHFHRIGSVDNFYLNANCVNCKGQGITPIPFSEVNL